MSILIDDILDMSLYQEMLEARYIKEVQHPRFPEIVIVNYTDSCMWDQFWNEVTMTCRGLIYNSETREILARPFRKFFNLGQMQAPIWNPDAKVQVLDKLDGSLGILFQLPNGEWEVASRGSFTSDQAIWATDVYKFYYSESFEPNPEWTYLFEMIYPENRIVVDYEGLQVLILIGVVDKENGETVPLEMVYEDWRGPIVPIYADDMPFKEVLELPDRPNAEGWVLWNYETDERVKIKYEDYVRLHRLLTVTNPKHVWEVLSSGQDATEIFASAPDEFHEWMKQVINEIETDRRAIYEEAMYEYTEILKELPEVFERKDFALKAQDAKHRSLMFLLLDQQDISDAIWKMVKPSGDRTVRSVNSDAD